LEELSSLPAGRVFGVEMNDASSRIVGPLLEDTLHRRRFCGEGDFDVRGFVGAIAKTGFGGPFGVEITSDELRRTPLSAAAERAYRTTVEFLG
jgi:sugar phosphate isomerase/epimerase